MNDLTKYKHGLKPFIEAGLAGQLPAIRGRWFGVDPYGVTNGDTPVEMGLAAVYTTLLDAYNACTTGVGDGIVLFSGGTGTSSQTTSYLKQSLAWSKSGITMVGLSSGTRLYGRARIANVEVTTGALTVLSFDDTASVYTINRSTGSFVTDGFVVGQKVVVDSTSNTNDGTFTVTAVAALSMTVTETLTDESAVTAGSTTIKSVNPSMIVVSGHNNTFINVHVGNFSSLVGAVGCLKVTGNRNAFMNCHFIGAGHATPAADAGAYDVELNGAQETTFVGCAFGTDTIIRAATNGNIRFDTNVWRSRFYGCEVLSYSATSTKGAILCVDATGMEGVQVFVDCQFINWNENGIDALASVFIGTKPTSGAILLHNPAVVGYTAIDSVGGNDMVYVAGYATAAGAGGISTTV